MIFDPSESSAVAGVLSAKSRSLRAGRVAANDGRPLVGALDFDEEPPVGAGRGVETWQDVSEDRLPTADRFAEALARLAEDR